MDDFLLVLLVAIASVATGLAAGYDSAKKSTAKNCEVLGHFRHGDKVFTCAPKERK